jgi:hypothetical protein
MAVKNVEDLLFEEIGKQIAKEIDDGILSTICIESGWTPVQFYFKNNNQAIDINEWLNETCEDKWARYGSDYLFKNKKDAEWFILRWL